LLRLNMRRDVGGHSAASGRCVTLGSTVESHQTSESVSRARPRRVRQHPRGAANLREQVDMGQANGPTVRCGCGRQMTPDSMRGPGAYGCGCGARVTVLLPDPPPRCAWLLEDGTQCRIVPLPPPDDRRSRPRIHGMVRYQEQPVEPVRLCADHAKAWRVKWFPEETTTERYTRLGRICDCSLAAERLEAERAAEPRPEPPSVVYYVRSGDLIKIGTTVNIRQRIQSFSMPWLELLATEPGDIRLERQRHREYAPLREKGEWFLAAPALLAHIARVKAEAAPVGAP
jgi:hypothetical protein